MRARTGCAVSLLCSICAFGCRRLHLLLLTYPEVVQHLGATIENVPTRFVRIPVTKDLALADAMARVAPLLDADQPAATLVHDLAIRGADALLDEHRRRADAIERLIERSTSPDPGFDVDVAKRIDELAWRGQV